MPKDPSPDQVRQRARQMAERTRHAAMEIRAQVAETRRQIATARKLLDHGATISPPAEIKE